MTLLSPDMVGLEGGKKKERKEARVGEWSERVKNKSERKKKSIVNKIIRCVCVCVWFLERIRHQSNGSLK